MAFCHPVCQQRFLNSEGLSSTLKVSTPYACRHPKRAHLEWTFKHVLGSMAVGRPSGAPIAVRAHFSLTSAGRTFAQTRMGFCCAGLELVGDRTECAMLEAVMRAGGDYKEARERATILHSYPFSSDRKRMSTLVLPPHPRFDITLSSEFLHDTMDILRAFTTVACRNKLDILKAISVACIQDGLTRALRGKDCLDLATMPRGQGLGCTVQNERRKSMPGVDQRCSRGSHGALYRCHAA